jgi:hypothetical protein
VQSKLILLDIDGVLFGPILFLNNFYENLLKTFKLKSKDIELVKLLYGKSRSETAYFMPNDFLAKIVNHFSFIKLQELDNLFWANNAFTKVLYSDVKELGSISKITKIGIFSKGDYKFQKTKLSTISIFIDPECVFIFANKINKIGEVFGKYAGYKIYLVDDKIDVLNAAKSINSDICSILIQREKSEIKNDKIDNTINSLSELSSLINE